MASTCNLRDDVMEAQRVCVREPRLDPSYGTMARNAALEGKSGVRPAALGVQERDPGRDSPHLEASLIAGITYAGLVTSCEIVGRSAGRGRRI